MTAVGGTSDGHHTLTLLQEHFCRRTFTDIAKSRAYYLPTGFGQNQNTDKRNVSYKEQSDNGPSDCKNGVASA